MRTLCALTFLLLLFPWGVRAQEARPSLDKPYLVAPFIMDNRTLGEAWVFPREEKSDFAIEAETLLRLLQPHLKDDRLALLRSRIRKEKTLTLRDLEAAGLSVKFDESTLEMYLDVPLRYRKTNELDLNYYDIDGQKFLRPQGQSGYLNIRTQQSYQYGSAVPEEKLPLTGHVDFVENVNGVVFETMADYLEGALHPWRRLDTRFRVDDERNMIRYTFGDLTLGSRGFQYSPNIAGISVVKEFSIQPYKTLRALSATEIIIKRPSLIEIYVNGFLFSQMRLAPGVFNIRDFPLATGQNSVKIKVRDDLGQEEIYDFSVLFENTLLGKDVHEFSYGLGLPWSESGADRAYDNTGALGTFFHRIGLSDQLTFGLNFQNYRSTALSGIEFSGVSNWGYISLEGGYSTGASQIQGYAERLRYRTLDRMFGRDVPVVLTFEAENRDVQFRPVSVFDLGLTNYLRRYDSQLNFRFANSWVLGVGAGAFEVSAGENKKIYRSNLIIPLSARTRLELSYNKSVEKETEDRGLLSFFWGESQGRYSASAYYDSLQRNTNLALNRNSLQKYNDSRWNVSLQESNGDSSGSLSGEYLAQPLSLRLDHFTSSRNGLQTHTTGVGLNTGFAWVGLQGAFTQPINDSFVLIHTKEFPSGQELIINPNGENGEAQLGPRTATVLRDQSAYYRYFVNVDSTSLPVGYLLEKEFYGVQPTYRSGIVIDLGLKKKVMVKGRLVSRSLQPLSFVAGDVINSQGQLVDNNFFTNKSGGFLIEGLEPGIYKVITDHPGSAPISFEVRNVDGNMLSLGDLIQQEEAGE